MRQSTREVPVFLADDGTEHATPELAVIHEVVRRFDAWGIGKGGEWDSRMTAEAVVEYADSLVRTLLPLCLRNTAKGPNDSDIVFWDIRSLTVLMAAEGNPPEAWVNVRVLNPDAPVRVLDLAPDVRRQLWQVLQTTFNIKP